MTGVKISTLPWADAATDTDQLEVNQGGVSRRVTVGQISSLVAAGILPPQRVAAVTYYVSTTGNDSNDGLTATPVLTFQKALDLCAATAAYSAGPFVIQAAAGTYTVPVELTYTPSLFITSPVSFSGAASGGVPITIIQGTADGTRTHDFLSGLDGVQFSFSNIMFQSFAVALSAGRARLSLTNIHAKNCNGVVSIGNMGWARVVGGDWDGRDLSNAMISNSVGFAAVIGSFWNLEQLDLVSGLLIHHWDRGMLGGECVSGHMDLMRFHDCTTGVELTRMAGAANMSGIQFWRCGIGLRFEGAIPNILISDAADFGQGTANACTANMLITSAPTNAQTDAIADLGQSVPAARSLWLVRTNVTESNRTGSVAEVTIFNPCSVVRGRVREGDELRVRLEGSCSGGLTALGTLRIKFGATILRAWTLPIGIASFIAEVNLTATNATNFRGTVWQIADTTGAPAVVDINTITTATNLVSLTADTPVTITWQAGAAADSFALAVGRCYSTIAGLTI